MVQSAFDEAMRGAAEVVTLAELAQRTLAPLGRAIGASDFLLGPEPLDAAPSHASPVAGASLLHGALAPLVAGYLQGYDADDPNVVAKATCTEPIMVHSRHMDVSAYRRSMVYNDFFRQYDLEHFLSLRLFDTPFGPLTLLYVRGRSAPDFRARDVQLLARTLPALNAAAIRAARHEELLGERRVLESLLARADERTHVVVTGAGRISWMSTRAEALLARRFAGRLPEVVLAAARRTAAFERGDSEDMLPMLTLQSGTGPALRVRFSIARTSLGEPFVEIDFDESALDALTKAEARVLVLLGEGLTNASIAQRLFVSVETVKTHVHRVLDKLGVSTRAQAALVARGLMPSR